MAEQEPAEVAATLVRTVALTTVLPGPERIFTGVRMRPGKRAEVTTAEVQDLLMGAQIFTTRAATILGTTIERVTPVFRLIQAIREGFSRRETTLEGGALRPQVFITAAMRMR